VRTGRLSPFVPFDPAKDSWACWDHVGSTGWPECYDPADPAGSCEYDPWGHQLDYDDIATVRDTVYAYYPECNYNTRSSRYWGMQVSPGEMIVTELRLYKNNANNVQGARELVETRYDLWDVRF